MLEGEFCLAEFILNRARSWIWQKHFSRESDVELITDTAERPKNTQCESAETSQSRIRCISINLPLRNDLKYAPLAQLVEHLTLNQGVHGSSP